MKLFLKGLLVWVAIVLIVSAGRAIAQDSPAVGNQLDGYPVVLDNQELFRIKQGLPGISSKERADIINQRLKKVTIDESVTIDALRVEPQADAFLIKAGDKALFTVRDVDAKAENRSSQAVAQERLQTIKTAIAQYREERSLKRLVFGILLTILSTIALLIFFKTQNIILTKLLDKIKAAYEANALRLRIQNTQLLASEAVHYLLNNIVRLIRLGLILGALYLYVPFVLSQFPATKPLANPIYNDIAERANHLIEAFVRYLPNLVTIIVIAIATYYVIGFVKLLILELGRSDFYTWFYPEWTRPTIRLATLLVIAIACVVAAPFLPGFGSPMFQGVSLFLGAIFGLSSTSIVANVISGIILVYTRAFRTGDFIRVNDTTGRVIEKSLFVTRIVDPKNVVTTIPNSVVLNSNVTNFSAILRQSNGHLVLHSTITLGYDVPWRTIHEVLIKAALNTVHIVSPPEPFVLQTSLNDFNVSYELNAHTDRPDLMPIIYSELHQNIQDYCNQAGIEILSPSYSALRDGNHSTIPADYLPEDYTSPTFQVRERNGD